MENDYLLKAEQARSFLQSYREETFIRHEWEELLEKLTDSEDPELHDRGVREREATKAGNRGRKVP